MKTRVRTRASSDKKGIKKMLSYPIININYFPLFIWFFVSVLIGLILWILLTYSFINYTILILLGWSIISSVFFKRMFSKKKKGIFFKKGVDIHNLDTNYLNHHNYFQSSKFEKLYKAYRKKELLLYRFVTFGFLIYITGMLNMIIGGKFLLLFFVIGSIVSYLYPIYGLKKYPKYINSSLYHNTITPKRFTTKRGKIFFY